MNTCTNFSWQDSGSRGKVSEPLKSLGYILWEPLTFIQNVVAIYPLFVKLFNQDYSDCLSPAASVVKCHINERAGPIFLLCSRQRTNIKQAG